MPKVGLLVVAVVAVWGGASVERGCRDARQSVLELTYPDKRDMRSAVNVLPQKTYLVAPDSLSVPTVGRERWDEHQDAAERQRLDKTFVNPQAADDSSIARGARKYMRTCVPCHGPDLAGDGPVAAKFIPPPDLLGATDRGRSDGFIYTYLRHGGAVMPNYGAIVTRQEAYDLINFIRHKQRTSPR